MQLTLAAARATAESCSEGWRKAVALLTAAFNASMGCAKSSSKESNGGPVSSASTSDSEPDAAAGSAGAEFAGSPVLLRFMTGVKTEEVASLLLCQTKQNIRFADCCDRGSTSDKR